MRKYIQWLLALHVCTEHSTKYITFGTRHLLLGELDIRTYLFKPWVTRMSTQIEVTFQGHLRPHDLQDHSRISKTSCLNKVYHRLKEFGLWQIKVKSHLYLNVFNIQAWLLPSILKLPVVLTASTKLWKVQKDPLAQLESYQVWC